MIIRGTQILAGQSQDKQLSQVAEELVWVDFVKCILPVEDCAVHRSTLC